MKTDRLLSMIIYLLNHNTVPARELARRFEVSVRTVQRDIEAIELSGIPIVSTQGPKGGYRILETYRMERSLMSPADLYHILRSLESLSQTLPDRPMEQTIEKMRLLLGAQSSQEFDKRDSRLSIDFSLLGGLPQTRDTFQIVRQATDTDRLLEFSNTNNNLQRTRRIIEPMTVAFRWRSWYLFGYCLMRKDYRLFRISRIEDARILEERFTRRNCSIEQFESRSERQTELCELTLRFDPAFGSMVKEYNSQESYTIEEDGSYVLRISMPEDGWLYGYILSFGTFVTVLAPEHVRQTVRSIALQIAGNNNEGTC